MSSRNASPVTSQLRLLRLALVLGAVVSFIPDAPLRADESLDANVRACARLQNDRERLVCYDRRVAPLASADAPQDEAPAEEMFGVDASMSAPAASEPERPASREELSEITAKVKSVQKVGRSTQIVLDNGHVWQTDDDRELLLKPGDSITITRAALGTFRLATPSNRYARVRRVQ